MAVERLMLTPAEGVSTGVGFYLSALDDVREDLRKLVADLSPEHLAQSAAAGMHPIGALVLHIGEAESWWIQRNVCGLELTEEEKQAAHWTDEFDDAETFARRGYTAQYCLDAIDRVRQRSRELLAAFSDDDLDRLFSYQRGERTIEASLRWVLHHLVDHEAHHKGQISLLKRLMNVQSEQP